MWIGQGLEDDEAAPPEYLSNTGIREGIPALLVLDRAKEEQIRLQAEGSAMITWVDTQLKKTQMALGACTGSRFICYFSAYMLLIYIPYQMCHFVDSWSFTRSI